MLNFSIDQSLIISLIMVSIRVGGIVLFAPFFSMTAFPATVRIYLTLFLSLVLVPIGQAPQLPSPFTLLGLSILLGQEALIGMSVGLVMRMLFAGVQLAGQLIGFQIGFSIVNIIDPQTAVQTSTLTVLVNFLALVIFLFANGHHFIIAALAGSYSYIPPMQAFLNRSVLDVIMGSAGRVWVVGLQLAAPMLFLMLFLDFVIGILGRIAPQIPILIITFPLKIIVGLLSIGLGMTYFREAILHFITIFENDSMMLLKALAHG